MIEVEVKTGAQLDVDTLKKCRIADCKDKATAHLNKLVAPHRRENIAIWGSGYGLTKDRLGAFILAVKNRCDHYEAVIDLADEPESIIIDYSDITP